MQSTGGAHRGQANELRPGDVQDATWPRLELAQPDRLYGMVRALDQDEVRSLPRGQNVLAKVRAVNRVPDLPGHALGRLVGQGGVPVKVGRRLLERGGPEEEKALDVPPAGIGFGRVHIDAEVEEVGDRDPRVPVEAGRRRLEDVQALEDHNVRPVDHRGFPGHDVVGEMRIHGAGHGGATRLEVREELDEPAQVIALREALSLHQPLRLEPAPWIEEAVRGDEVDFGMLPPVREQLAEDPRGRALPHRHASGETDHVRHLGGDVAQERGPGLVEDLLGGHVEVEEPRERQVDLNHLVHGHPLIQALESEEIFEGQRQRGIGAQPSPLRPAELRVP